MYLGTSLSYETSHTTVTYQATIISSPREQIRCWMNESLTWRNQAFCSSFFLLEFLALFSDSQSEAEKSWAVLMHFWHVPRDIVIIWKRCPKARCPVARENDQENDHHPTIKTWRFMVLDVCKRLSCPVSSIDTLAKAPFGMQKGLPPAFETRLRNMDMMNLERWCIWIVQGSLYIHTWLRFIDWGVTLKKTLVSNGLDCFADEWPRWRRAHATSSPDAYKLTRK